MSCSERQISVLESGSPSQAQLLTACDICSSNIQEDVLVSVAKSAGASVNKQEHIVTSRGGLSFVSTSGDHNNDETD